MAVIIPAHPKSPEADFLKRIDGSSERCIARKELTVANPDLKVGDIIVYVHGDGELRRLRSDDTHLTETIAGLVLEADSAGDFARVVTHNAVVKVSQLIIPVGTDMTQLEAMLLKKGFTLSEAFSDVVMP